MDQNRAGRQKAEIFHQESGELRKGCSKFLRFFCLFLTILWMIVIWSFSAKPSDVSTATSHRAGRLIAGVIYQDFHLWETEEQIAFVETIDYRVRKAAHATEYAVLGGLLTLTLFAFGRSKQGSLAWGIGSAYAVSDEIHQYFVPGRSCQLSDMLLDSSGVLAGVLLYMLFLRLLVIFYHSQTNTR